MVWGKRQVEKSYQPLSYEFARSLQAERAYDVSMWHDQRYHCIDQRTLHAFPEKNKSGWPREHSRRNLGWSGWLMRIVIWISQHHKGF